MSGGFLHSSRLSLMRHGDVYTVTRASFLEVGASLGAGGHSGGAGDRSRNPRGPSRGGVAAAWGAPRCARPSADASRGRGGPGAGTGRAGAAGRGQLAPDPRGFRGVRTAPQRRPLMGGHLRSTRAPGAATRGSSVWVADAKKVGGASPGTNEGAHVPRHSAERNDTQHRTGEGKDHDEVGRRGRARVRLVQPAARREARETEAATPNLANGRRSAAPLGIRSADPGAGAGDV